MIVYPIGRLFNAWIPEIDKLFDKKTYFLIVYWLKEWYVLAMLERSAEKYLNDWHRKERRKPLVLRGARQVGKSTLVRRFAEKNGLV